MQHGRGADKRRGIGAAERFIQEAVVTAATILADIIGVAGLTMAGYYAYRPGKIPTSLAGDDPLRRTFHKLFRRRRLTASLMALVAAMFLIGVNFLNDLSALPMVTLWMSLLIMLFVVLVLAYLDLRTLTGIRNDLDRKLRDLDRILGTDRPGGNEE